MDPDRRTSVVRAVNRGPLELKRWEAVAQVVKSEGLSGARTRALRKLWKASGISVDVPPLLPEDVSDSRLLDLATPAESIPRGRSLTVGWVVTPPSRGSGGHTTILRMVQALEEAGHRCELLLYDSFRGTADRHADVVRHNWPWIKADVRDVKSAGRAPDVCIATSWPTAHVLAGQRWATRRMYFVQDYEPFFYPRGSQYALVEDTYRFGFDTVSIGHMVADLLREHNDVAAAVAPFGTDTNVYHLDNRGQRHGVVFYTKPDVPRRGFALGVAALEQFHAQAPEQEIFVFGDRVPKLPFPTTRLPGRTPGELNELYNRTITGLAMSFTNISLVAEEMLAAGNIPVVNDSPLARVDIESPHVRWAAPTPAAVADALVDVVRWPAMPERAVAAALSVRADDWKPAKDVLVAAVERLAYGS